MCLSTAFKEGLDGAENEKICEFVSEIRADAGKVTLVDIMGKEIEVPGSIKSMDFVKSIIILGE